MRLRPASLILLLSLLAASASAGEDYYSVLGIGKDADNRQIRKAFKKLALKYHPDKNSDEDAQEKFVKINKAYETLKDEDKRKRYDRFGEEEEDGQGGGGQGQQRQGYQSWNYYHDDFGLYDDDPEIVTLDYHDFRRSVSSSSHVWFVNFYSPQCGHCHELAPTWRRVARLLQGIVRVGAVNCQDDWQLCRQQNIRSYPTLLLYTPDGTATRFQGPKEEDDLVEFAVENLPDKIIRLRKANFEQVVYKESRRDLPWVILFCRQRDDFRCPGKQERHLLANLLHGLVNLGSMDCDANKKLCSDMVGEDESGGVYYETAKDISEKSGKRLTNSEFRELADEILSLLPKVNELDDEQYSKIRLRLEDDLGSPWLVRFVFGSDGASEDQKRLPSLLENDGVKFGRMDCEKYAEVCKELLVRKPVYACFKLGDGYEFHFGRDDPADVAEFARVSARARSMRTLLAEDFPAAVTDQPVFVDFFAPWCPPCLNLLPEYRKASVRVGRSVTFATVDCTTQRRVCDQYNVRSYPTTIFFNQSKLHYYQGEHSVDGLADFVQEVLRPSVVSLTYQDFQARIARKPEEEMWLVDFYAPWCGPCMQLAPQWTKLAQLVKKIPEVKVAKVDCTAEDYLCQQQVVRSYPTVRMYPLGSKGIAKYFVYTGFHRDAYSLRDWVYESLPSFVENLTPHAFQHKVLGSGGRPALVYFYTPWCGHCQHFTPTFDDVSLDLRDLILTGKVNCERFGRLCSQEGVRAYPTVKFYPGPGLADGGAEELQNRAPDYIVGFVKDRLERLAKRPISHDEL